MQKGTFTVFVIIVLLICANLYHGKEANASKAYQYKTVWAEVRGSEADKMLNDNAKAGWELVTTNFQQWVFRK